jgi:hypothetical protein
MLSVIILNVVMLSVVMLSVVMLSVVMLSVIVLSVVAPEKKFYNIDALKSRRCGDAMRRRNWDPSSTKRR